MKTAWVIKKGNSKYVNARGNGYTEDIDKSCIYDREKDAAGDVDSSVPGKEHPVQVRISIEEVA